MNFWDQNLLKFFSKVREPAAVCDRRGVFVHVNQAGLRLLRAAHPDNVLGRPMADFLDPAYGDLKSIGLSVFAAETEGVPLKMMTVNGDTIDIVFHASDISDVPGMDGHYLVECRDVTHFIQASEAARMREKRLDTVLKAVDQAVISIDEFGTIQGFNEAAERIFGHPRTTAIGQNIAIIMPESHRADHTQYIFNYLAGGKAKILERTRELEGVRADGSVFPIEITVSEHVERDNRRTFIGIIRDISQSKEQEERIKFLALHDALTALPNRHAFRDRLDEALRRCGHDGTKVALLYIDLDNFKPINDGLGHDAGDHVLKTVADRFTACLREIDMVARIGGDEFAIVIENFRSRDVPEKLANAILAALDQPIAYEDTDCRVGGSIGIGLYPDDADDKDGLIKASDRAMYAVKNTGRNAYRFASSTSGGIAAD